MAKYRISLNFEKKSLAESDLPEAIKKLSDMVMPEGFSKGGLSVNQEWEEAPIGVSSTVRKVTKRRKKGGSK